MNAHAGPFLLERALDGGGMSQVWEGLAPDGTRVAIKTLTQDAADQEEHRAALQLEAERLAALQHPHIVRYLGRGVLGAEVPAPLLPEAPWFATELARGGDLCRLAGRAPWPRVRRLLEQALSALSYLHGEGLLHLDLKPSNLLLAGPDHVRLCDLGLARELWDPGPPSEWGTPAYMAPEQLRDPPGRVTERTDLYSFGCVAWTLLTGRPPFGRGAEEASVNHLYGAAPCLPEGLELPPGAEAWLRSLLRRGPAQRPASAEEALQALMAVGKAHARQRWVLFPSEAPAVTTRRVVG
ncbi:MAG: serine/threonine protein kinase [Alphaproteobacteria bacterium]|nr:serine/threonine protein kinase [Alphaproteobacteria bacterium]MCB9791421.1 serine/threonine protein kinase [Alphaproteobacteria bacterium]